MIDGLYIYTAVLVLVAIQRGFTLLPSLESDPQPIQLKDRSLDVKQLQAGIGSR